MNQKKVGKVNLKYISSKLSTAYSDGPVEDELLEIYSSDNPEQQRDKALASNPSWPLYYHLSPKRQNLLRWYDFKPGASIVEIGAGCGAITESLVRKGKVTAIELTEKRSLINAYRNKKADNLEIAVGNMDDYKPTTKFDYVVCVGVLEYAGSFTPGENPYKDFLKKIKDLLKSDGKLLLAIENKLGLKYWAGAREDHTAGFFDGINAYPGKKKVRTFGRLELKKLLKETGFKTTYFYYPFPDYKTPQVIYSDDYVPGENTYFPLNLLPTPVLDQSRYNIFSEQIAMLSIENNHLFKDFSNSFLVEASL